VATNAWNTCLTKKIILLCIYFINYLLLFSIKIKHFEQTDNNIRSFDHNKRIICYANFVLGIATWQFDHINLMITLSVISLSGVHCITLIINNYKFFIISNSMIVLFQLTLQSSLLSAINVKKPSSISVNSTYTSQHPMEAKT
jgi:hypothetical protein